MLYDLNQFSILSADLSSLKEKDSMYYYLNKINNPNRIKVPNSRREFNPYRKEERYKAVLRKNYFPITHWNE